MRIRLVITAWVWMFFSCASSYAQSPGAVEVPPVDSAESVEKEQSVELSPKEKAAKKRLDYMFDSCDGYTGVRKSDAAKLKLIPKPLLRWTNPNFGVRDGLFVAWVDGKNRPVAAGQVFLMPGSDNRWFVEQQSLSDSPMQFESESNEEWRPGKPGVKWVQFKKDALMPAKSKPIRLGQMRSLARRFRGENGLTTDNFDLRLLTNPMARYADKENWWALAAMTSARLDGYLDGEPVWTKPQSGGSPTDVFYMRPLSGGVPFPEE